MDKTIRNFIITASITLIAIRYALYIDGLISFILFVIGVPLLFIFTILLIIRAIWIVSVNKISKQTVSPIIIGFIAILIAWIEPIGFIANKLKSPILMSGECEHTVTSVFMTLREDGTFEYSPDNFMARGQNTGNYDFKGDTILLHYDDKNLTTVPEKMIIVEKGLQCIGDSNKHQHGFKFRINKTIKK